MESLLIASAVVLLASMLQSCTGFGFSIMATPFLLLVYEPRMAIQINIILSVLISAAMLPRVAGAIDRVLLVRLIKGGALGAPIGIAVFLFLDVHVLKLIVSILILVLTALLIFKFSVKQTSPRDHVAGGFSGLFTTSIGIPGPPLLLYFSGARMDKAVLRSTTLAFFLFIYAISLAMQIGFGSSDRQTWIMALVLSPVVALGMVLGQIAFKYINQSIFQIITYVILIATGSYLLASAV